MGKTRAVTPAKRCCRNLGKRRWWQLWLESISAGLCTKALESISGIQSLPGILTSCVILDKLLNFSAPDFPHP